MGWRDVAFDLASGVGRMTLALAKAVAPEDDEDDEEAPETAPNAGAPPDPQAEGMPLSPLVKLHGEAQAPQKMVPQTPEELQKAVGDPSSLFWDPYSIIDALGYKERPSAITYRTLQQMVWRMPIIQAIIQTRINQVLSFAQPQADRFSTGYRVKLRDPKAKMTPAAEARSQQLERWLLTTGVTDNPTARDSFREFLTKLTRDSLTYDQATFEIVPARNGRPANFYAVDAATIRRADTTRIFLDPEDNQIVRFVQVYDGVIVAEYTSQQLAFGVRNPATEIRLQGYGQSELEMLVTTITALLWGWSYNQKFFSQGSNVKGVLNFQGTVPDTRMKAFRRHWYSMVAGVENAFRTPITNAEGLQWINMQMSNRDMEFNAWFDFLIKIATGVYQMDPMEVNFKYGDSGGAKPMFESANQSKLSASKDKGLKPLLTFLSQMMSLYLITPMDEDFEFGFVGLDAQSPNEQADLSMKLVKTSKTVDEIRALNDDPPLPNGMGAIILDPVFFQHMQTSAQQATGTGAFAPPQPPMFGKDGDEEKDPFSSLRDDLGKEGGDGPAEPAEPAKPPAPFGKSADNRLVIDLEL